MKPYYLGAARRFSVLLILLLTASTLRAGDFDTVVPSRNPLAKRAFEHFYNMEYDRSIKEFEQLVKEYPENPIANNYLLSAVMFKEMYRIGALDSESYANDSFLDIKAKRPLDPEVTKRVDELLDRSEKLCNDRLQKTPNDIDALYARGVARGMRSTFMGMGQRAWLAAARSALSARRDHERVLQLDPTFVDAKMSVGIHNYIIGSLNWFYRSMIALAGVTGNKQKGLDYLRQVADANGQASMDARIALALFLRREQKYPEALKVVKSMMDQYPKNYLAAIEYAHLLNAAGRGREAVDTYRKVLSSCREGKFPLCDPQSVAFGLGGALRGQRRFDEAADAFAMVESFPQPEKKLVLRSKLAAGEMYDSAAKRELAIQEYKEVLAADASSPEGQAAKKHIGKPYRYD
jgi:tetratricopeptide (TPR) repeat protein